MFNDPILNDLIKKYPTPKFEDRSEHLFERLIESVVSQQLSVKASDKIFLRFKDLFLKKEFPLPNDVLEMEDKKIRTAGISFAKISYIKAISQAFLADQVNIKKIRKMSDEEVIKELTKIKGIGKWTAEMILIFTLKRKDIFSLGDLGLRRAIENLYGIKDSKEIIKLSEKWKPHRSLACWYLWRSLENKK